MVKQILHKLFLLLFIGLFICVPRSHAQEEVHMKVRSDGLRRIVIAVAPFTAALPTDLTIHLRKVIINDLQLSGYFQVRDLPQPLLTGSGNSGGFSSNTMASSASIYLQGHLDVRGDEIRLRAQIHEIASNLRFLDKEYSTPVLRIRQLAHRVADAIAQTMTGDQGIASTKIVFAAIRAEAKELAMIDYDGFGKRRVTSNGSLNLSPTWSPDGAYLAFTSYVQDNPDLMVMRLKDGRTVNLSKQDILHSAPAWSPKGKHIALAMTEKGNSDIFTMDTGGKRIRRITNGPSIDTEPSWSPNGRQIAYTSDRSGNPQIYIIESDGTSRRRLTFEGNYNASPAWSPRGDCIAYVSREAGGFEIYSIDVNGENVQKLTDNPGNNENPTWSPNGMWLAFASNRTGQWDIYVIHQDGKELRRVTRDGGNTAPRWSPRFPWQD